MLQLDYANCLSPRVGDAGLDPRQFDAAESMLTGLTGQLESSRGQGWERWRMLPFDPLRTQHLDAIREVVRRFEGSTENLVVLGIGGSALGNIALQAALNPLTYNLMPADMRAGPRLFVLDNVDPHLVHQTLQEVRRADPDLAHTCVNVISKSGETAETAAQFLITRSMLKAARGERYAEQIVAITDPAKGTMRAICDAEGYATLPVPDGVGGRFSVLSPVGLFSAAMCGIDIEELLNGAAAMDDACRRSSPLENPAALLAFLLIEHLRRGRGNHVLMAYSNQLYALADWFRQLWAESLGKRLSRDGREIFAGGTPIKALGTTDQHSQVQLYREGPDDKVIGLLEVAQFDDDLAVPADVEVEALRYLAGRSLAALLAAEKRATEYALVESRRPNFTITFPRLDAYHVGQFIQLWEITTAYAGLLLDVDAYDQPAVETGKVATFGLMGRPGYEQWKDTVDEVLAPRAYVV